MKPARLALILALATTTAFLPAMARADGCDAATEERLGFLEERLEAARPRTSLWWHAWLGVFSIGLVFKTTQGALRGDDSNAAADFFAAGKSAAGIAELVLRPHSGRHGAAPMRAIPKSTAANCAERLRLAETSMEQAADQASGRWSWKRHLSSLLLNVATSTAVDEGWNDEGTAWRDFAVSQVSSELHIFTHPTRARDDWSEYRSRFLGAPSAAAPPRLRLAATARGLGLRMEF